MTNEYETPVVLTDGDLWDSDYIEVSHASVHNSLVLDSLIDGESVAESHTEVIDLLFGLTGLNGAKADVKFTIDRENALALADALFRVYAKRNAYVVAADQVLDMDEVNKDAAAWNLEETPAQGGFLNDLTWLGDVVNFSYKLDHEW